VLCFSVKVRFRQYQLCVNSTSFGFPCERAPKLFCAHACLTTSEPRPPFFPLTRPDGGNNDEQVPGGAAAAAAADRTAAVRSTDNAYARVAVHRRPRQVLRGTHR